MENNNSPTPIIGTFSRGLVTRRHLGAALGGRVLRLGRHNDGTALSAVVGWGRKDNTNRARSFAANAGLPYICIEDGFIRSIGLGVNNAQPFGFIVDTSAIYYDATRPSDLEILIQSNGEGGGDLDRARRLMARIVKEQIYKYNHVWDSVRLPQTRRPRILLIDQTRGDLSVTYGMAGADSFRQMLDSARKRYPDGAFFVKTHPDVIAGKKKGYLLDDLPADVMRIGDDCNPYALLHQVDHVYTVSSQMGFEALLAGKPVTCFGMPFYAGWGVTEDRVHCARRGVTRSMEALFDAAYLKYVRYVDPLTGDPCELEQILDRIVFHKQVALENKGKVFCFGFRFWKRGIINRFLDASDADVRFTRRPETAERTGLDGESRIAVWGLRNDTGVMKLATRHGIRVERIEDGFIRSVGLGSDFAPPSSLIVDRRGIYFDPRRPSELENLLNTVVLDGNARKAARRLRRSIIALGMSKYNTGCNEPLHVDAQPDQPVVLVPGQVEDDASIQAGCVDIRTNIGLLKAVRRQSPDAYIIYKPHPDVLAGNRRGFIPKDRALSHCDRIVTDRNIIQCLDRVDQVHTLTSLTGFEALLRDKAVFTYGRPFYSGWGLTVDRHPSPRRTRSLTIDELVYCSLILYPRYYDWDARCFVQAEDVVEKLRKQLLSRDLSIKPSVHRHLRRKALFLMEDLREAMGTIRIK